EVVRHELVVAAVVHALAAALRPLAGAKLRDVDDLLRIGERRVAHPDPDPAPALGHREAAHRGARRNLLLAGDAHALAAAVEGHAVVAALQRVALERALGKGEVAVRAGVLEGD